jgi:hypothetical protein
MILKTTYLFMIFRCALWNVMRSINFQNSPPTLVANEKVGFFVASIIR